MALDVQSQLGWLEATLEAGNKFYGLVLALSTGAVVLFVNLLVAVRAPRWILWILGLAIISFGLAAVLSLRVLFFFLQLRLVLGDAFVSQRDDAAQTLQSKVDELKKKLKCEARFLEPFFYAAIFFAFIFVLALLVTR